VLASAGVVLYVVGIPVLFFYAIKNRNRPTWHFSSRFLHHGFVDEWKYYEIVDLIRKLTITSISQFVASPSSPSQVMFMLVVDCCALYLLTTASPYQHPNDNNLSTVLTTIECICFLFALVIVTGMNDTEGYDENRMFNSVVLLLVLGLLVVTPYTYMRKIDYFNSKIEAAKAKIGHYLCMPFLSQGADLPALARWSRSGRLTRGSSSAEMMRRKTASCSNDLGDLPGALSVMEANAGPGDVSSIHTARVGFGRDSGSDDAVKGNNNGGSGDNNADKNDNAPAAGGGGAGGTTLSPLQLDS
jgi:hypothetical protein